MTVHKGDCGSSVLDARAEAMVALLTWLDASGYDFVPVTAATHARVLARDPGRMASSPRDVFGWNRQFPACVLPGELFAVLDDAGLIERPQPAIYRSRLRAARIEGRLLLHSAFETRDADAVFLGPDSYRFAQLVLASLDFRQPCRSVLDYGAGAGVGGLIAALACGADRVTMADRNPAALEMARVNAAHAGLPVTTIEALSPGDLEGSFDLVVMHPPFMIDPSGRAWRDGGQLNGAQVSLEWCAAGAARLAPGGRLIMHTAAAIIDGRDLLRGALEDMLAPTHFGLGYRELESDIFGDELSTPAYRVVDRIAAVGIEIAAPNYGS